MQRRSQPLLPVQEKTQEGRFEEEREDSLHRQGLPDNAAGAFGEGRPVGSELKLHGDPGHDPHGEVQGKEPRPEAHGFAIRRVALPQS